MPICSNCGEENRKNAIYCKKCGNKLAKYVKQSEKWNIVHIGVLLLSVIVLITSFGLIMGGTSLRSIQELMTDDEEFIMSKLQNLEVSSYAIVVENMDFDIDPVVWRWFERSGGFLRFKIIIESNKPDQAIFVGVARYQDIYNYIEPVEYHIIKDLDFGFENLDMGTPTTSYILHSGIAPITSPTIHSY